MRDENKWIVEYDEQQIAALAAFMPIQFLPRIAETPEQRYLRHLRECGVFLSRTNEAGTNP